MFGGGWGAARGSTASSSTAPSPPATTRSAGPASGAAAAPPAGALLSPGPRPPPGQQTPGRARAATGVTPRTPKGPTPRRAAVGQSPRGKSPRAQVVALSSSTPPGSYQGDVVPPVNGRLDWLPDGVRLFETTEEVRMRLENRTVEYTQDAPTIAKIADIKFEYEAETRVKEVVDSDFGKMSAEREKLLGEGILVERARTAGKKFQPPTALRICQIDHRLQSDPMLEIDDAFEMPDAPAHSVKHELRRTYARIRRTAFELPENIKHQLDEAIKTLRDV